jgi:hypothetical protein
MGFERHEACGGAASRAMMISVSWPDSSDSTGLERCVSASGMLTVGIRQSLCWSDLTRLNWFCFKLYRGIADLLTCRGICLGGSRGVVPYR